MTIKSVIIFRLIVGMGIWAVKCAMDSMFMVMNWLNIMLIIESVVEDVVVLVINFMAVLVLVLRHITVAIMSWGIADSV